MMNEAEIKAIHEKVYRSNTSYVPTGDGDPPEVIAAMLEGYLDIIRQQAWERLGVTGEDKPLFEGIDKVSSKLQLMRGF
jgi:hypothetical protein